MAKKKSKKGRTNAQKFSPMKMAGASRVAGTQRTRASAETAARGARSASYSAVGGGR